MNKVFAAILIISVTFVFTGCPGKTKDKAIQVEKTVAKEVSQSDFESVVALYKEQEQSGVINYDELISKFKTFESSGALNPEIYYNLGYLYEKKGDLENAEKYYRMASQKMDIALENLINVYRKGNKLNQAAEIAKSLLKKDEKSARYNVILASIYKEQNKPEDAIRYCRKALRFDPTNLEAYRVLSMVYYNANKLQLARLT
ncbi:MAG: tetratricopeptide repeat protein, partial [Deltaproteobacteria bacterium]|nr:tetratricopeptide repeat protein [Deltaproteobacteria bacterium]